MSRFGLSIDDETIYEISQSIEAYIPVPIFVTSNGFSFHTFLIDNCKVVILYDWVLRCPITVYRLSWFSSKNGVLFPNKNYLQ